MDASVIVRRIRTAIGQQTYYGEPVDSKASVLTSSRTAFSDRDILERINEVIASIFPVLDEAFVTIEKITNPTNPISENYSLLTSRIYRNGVRARQYEREDAVKLMYALREATDSAPVFILENDFLQVFPAGGTIEVYAKKKPKVVTWTEYTSANVSTDIDIPTAFIEFVVQIVASELRATMASDEPHDNDIYLTASRWNLIAANEEITAFMPTSNILQVMQ